MNTFYATRSESGIKYHFNHGYINIDNPKLAVRYFLNAIDRVGALSEKYAGELKQLDVSIPQLETFCVKPFEKESELKEMKKELSRLEHDITINIQKKQLLSQEPVVTVAGEESKVIQMDVQEEGIKVLLPKLRENSSRGLHI